MKLLLSETEKRVEIKLNKSIRPGNFNGVMDFGENNDYPNIIERVLNSSVSGRSIANIHAKFLTGAGFENQIINDVVIGKDARGKDVTIYALLKLCAYDLSVNNGCYIHTSIDLNRKIKAAKYIPFKYCRFSQPDDTGYCSQIAVYENWEKDSAVKFDKTKIRTYPIFNLNKEVFNSQVQNIGLENFKGQINFLFFDNQYLYPLAKIDSVYMDIDSEGQISVYKNNQLRNGFADKVVMRLQPPANEKEREEFIETVKKFAGVDGDPVLILEDEIDENGEIKKTGAFALDKITSNINDKLFENWEKSLANNIRKAYDALPAVLIDYEESKLGTTSGEAIQQATNFYNAMTAEYRNQLSQFFKDIFENSDNGVLSGNENWNIKQLSLYGNNTTIQ